jgi:hypothetical protein
MPGHRPYAKNPNAPPSVTQIINTLDKPGLSWGAARETASYAVHHCDQWQNLPVADAVTTLYRHHRGVWDHRALVGSALHEINAQWCQGNAVSLRDIVSSIRERSRLWQQTPSADLYAELLPMADGLGAWWRKAQPEPLSWEEVVRYSIHPHLAYIGTLDWRALIGGRAILIDLKTTGSRKHGQGKYWDQWRLQLAAYRYATEGVLYGDDDQETTTTLLPDVEAAAILHLYQDGHTEFHPVKAGPVEHEVFLSLRKVYGWRQGDGQGMGDVDITPALGVAG